MSSYRGMHAWGGALLALALAPAALKAVPVFEARTDARLTGLRTPVAVAVGDFIEDGALLPDLAISFAGTDTVAFIENNGDGTFDFANSRGNLQTIEAFEPPVGQFPSVVGSMPAALLPIDCAGDGGLDDIIGVNKEQRWFFSYLNPGPGGGDWVPTDLEADGGQGLDLALADWQSPRLPADGRPDLFICTANGGIRAAIHGAGPCDFSGVSFFFDETANVGVLVDVEVGNFVDLPGDPMDGQLDVLTVDNSRSQLVIWPGDPTIDVAFLDVIRKPVELDGEMLAPIEAVIDEFTGDGIDDALVATEEGYVLVFPGNRDAALLGFDDPTVIDVVAPLIGGGQRLPTRLTSMQYRDVVGADGASPPDGIRDLVLADSGQGTGSTEGFNWLWIVPGTGAGPMPEFALDAQYHYAASDLAVQTPQALAVFDFGADGAGPDGADDVVLVNADASTVTPFLNDGSGQFDAARSFALGGVEPRGSGVRLLPSETEADLVVTVAAEQTLYVGDGDGDGGFVEPFTPNEPAGRNLGRDVKVDFFDGDDIPDAILTFQQSHVFFRGNPDGSFAAPEVIQDGGRDVVGTSRAGELGDGAVPSALDLAVFNRQNPVNEVLQIWLGDGTGQFSLGQEIPSINRYATHVVAPFFGGSRDDILVAGETMPTSSPALLTVFSYDEGAGEYVAASQFTLPPPFDSVPIPVSLIVPGRFVGNDELLDVVVIISGGDAFMVRNFGSTFQVVDPLLGFSVGGGPRSGRAVALTPGAPDSLVVATADKLNVLEGNGVSLSGVVSFPSNIDNASVSALDLNGDDLPELVTTSARTNDVTVFVSGSVPGVLPFVLRVRETMAGTEVSVPTRAGANYSSVRGELGLLWDQDPTVTPQPLPLTNPTCLLIADPSNLLTDNDPLPDDAIAGYWYLFRCADGECDSVGDQSFGSDSAGMARFMDDPPEPCP